ncbi:MAG: hypothetical protein KatS3mg105_0844 [Gemmatales bacterium]|nr:MAG: hypothetical protein KatS3mg105_0844 [Gemmatales bacterium]
MKADFNSILSTLTGFLQEETDFDVSTIAADSPLREEIGLDSIDLVGILMRIEGHYRIRLGHEDIADVVTVGDLIRVIQAKLDDKGESSKVA